MEGWMNLYDGGGIRVLKRVYYLSHHRPMALAATVSSSQISLDIRHPKYGLDLPPDQKQSQVKVSRDSLLKCNVILVVTGILGEG